VKRRLLLVLLGILAVVVPLAVAEIVLRAAGIPELTPWERFTELDEHLWTRTRRNLDIRTFDRKVRVRTNSVGFRYPEIPVAKPAGVRRLFAMGDSTTFGYGVEDDETYSHLIEVELNSRGSGGRWEVINAGVTGYNSAQGLLFLRRIILKYAPDVLIVSYAINDNDWAIEPYVYGARTMKELTQRQAWAVGTRNFLYNHSALFRWAYRALMFGRYRKWMGRHMQEIIDKKINLIPEADYRANLRAFKEEAAAIGCRVVFLPTPVQLKASRYPAWGPEPGKGKEACMRVVRSTLAEIPHARKPEQLSAMYFHLARAYEGAGLREEALKAYMKVLEHEEQTTNWRWRSLEYQKIMLDVAGRNGIPVANVPPVFARREMADNPDGLFSDMYHAGWLGHRMIAKELLKVLEANRMVPPPAGRPRVQ
jgi:lysophospholipase L1-like esterase